VAFIQARTAADQAKYASPPAANTNDLALAAGKAERELAFLNADAAVLKAEQVLNVANVSIKPNDEPTKQAVANAEKALADARAVRDAADKARAEATANYSPLGAVYPTASTGVARRWPAGSPIAATHWPRG